MRSLINRGLLVVLLFASAVFGPMAAAATAPGDDASVSAIVDGSPSSAIDDSAAADAEATRPLAGAAVYAVPALVPLRPAPLRLARALASPSLLRAPAVEEETSDRRPHRVWQRLGRSRSDHAGDA